MNEWGKQGKVTNGTSSRSPANRSSSSLLESLLLEAYLRHRLHKADEQAKREVPSPGGTLEQEVSRLMSALGHGKPPDLRQSSPSSLDVTVNDRLLLRSLLQSSVSSSANANASTRTDRETMNPLLSLLLEARAGTPRVDGPRQVAPPQVDRQVQPLNEQEEAQLQELLARSLMSSRSTLSQEQQDSIASNQAGNGVDPSSTVVGGSSSKGLLEKLLAQRLMPQNQPPPPSFQAPTAPSNTHVDETWNSIYAKLSNPSRAFPRAHASMDFNQSPSNLELELLKQLLLRDKSYDNHGTHPLLQNSSLLEDLLQHAGPRGTEFNASSRCLRQDLLGRHVSTPAAFSSTPLQPASCSTPTADSTHNGLTEYLRQALVAKTIPPASNRPSPPSEQLLRHLLESKQVNASAESLPQANQRSNLQQDFLSWQQSQQEASRKMSPAPAPSAPLLPRKGNPKDNTETPSASTAMPSLEQVAQELASPQHLRRKQNENGKQFQRWAMRLSELKEFRRVHGHALVPIEKYDPNPALSHWVKRQRHQKKMKEEGKPSTLSDEREALLNELDFVWDSHSATWQQRFDDLRAYKDRYGNCNVPCSSAAHPQLAIWVKCQRRQYQLWKEGKKCHMTEERRAQLEAIGFVWSPRQGAVGSGSTQ